MLKKTRQILGLISILMVTLLFLDFTGTAHAWLGWMAKIQFLPALLAANFVVVASLVILTLLFGRVYCSVICPLGIMQDFFARLGRKRKKFRYSYSPAKKCLRYSLLAVMAAAIAAGIGSIVALLAPYSAFGRIVQSLLAPVWAWGNNLLASWAEHLDSYAFYSTEVWLKSGVTLGVALATLGLVAFLSWRNGRTYCNTVCPVGTVLGFFARFSLFRPVIDNKKCVSCGLCSRACKAACIDGKHHSIDLSRCVACMNCLETCTHGAISYRLNPALVRKRDEAPAEVAEDSVEETVAVDESKPARIEKVDGSRRTFLTLAAATAAIAAVEAQTKKVDGGLAVIEDKIKPERRTRIVPPGAISLRNMERHCTACQLCVAACPNEVLRPSSGILTLMQPESSYERGYCRPECTRCSDVCPSGAIRPIDVAQKSSIQIGHAVWVKANCIPLTDGQSCGNCARHCPVGAITMVPSRPGDESSPRIPVVNEARCIGCGACENLCPARPFSAIYVEGHEVHREI